MSGWDTDSICRVQGYVRSCWQFPSFRIDGWFFGSPSDPGAKQSTRRPLFFKGIQTLTFCCSLVDRDALQLDPSVGMLATDDRLVLVDHLEGRASSVSCARYGKSIPIIIDCNGDIMC